MTTMTRGPLPPRVYWARRLLLLSVVIGLVLTGVGVVRLAGGGPSEPEQARLAGSTTETSGAETEPEADPPPTQGVKGAKGAGQGEGQSEGKRRKDKGPVLASPDGPCVDRDIAVTPTAKKTVAGGPVTFTLQLRTILSPACTWEVSPKTLTVKIRSGQDDIWFSSQCPRAIPTESVVLRNNVTTEVEVTWSARRSDEGCTRYAGWAMPGWYHVEAAALAGEPSDLHFQLDRPEPEVVTEKVPPKNGGKNRDGNDRDGKNRDGNDRGGNDRG
ncbi:MAG: hypothetical protein ACRDO4_13150 [Nocardioides sp.]